MTREEALKKVKVYLTDYFNADCYEEVEEIMEALEQQPCSDKDTVNKNIAAAFQFGTAMGFATKYDEMDRVTEEVKKVVTANQKPCEDAVSRQTVLDKIKEVCFSKEQKWVDFRVSQGSNGERDFIINFIESLPSAQPKEKTGKWIYDYVSADEHRVYHCSECGCYLKPKHSEPLSSYKWCSLCGARMVEQQESEE